MQDIEAVSLELDLVVAMGGDGTMLWVSNLFPTTCPPVLGVDMGSLGYLAQFDVREAVAVVTKSLVEGFYVCHRHRIEVSVYDGPTLVQCHSGLNELCIDRGPSSNLTCLDVHFNNEFFTNVAADGLVVATPTGSTAYSMSAGGSMVHPAVPAMLFTPICPHSLSFRPLVLPSTSVLRISVPEDARGSAWSSVDGKHKVEVRKGMEVVVRMTDEFPFPMVLRHPSSETDYWLDSLKKGLNWNQRVKQLALDYSNAQHKLHLSQYQFAASELAYQNSGSARPTTHAVGLPGRKPSTASAAVSRQSPALGPTPDRAPLAAALREPVVAVTGPTDRQPALQSGSAGSLASSVELENPTAVTPANKTQQAAAPAAAFGRPAIVFDDAEEAPRAVHWVGPPDSALAERLAALPTAASTAPGKRGPARYTPPTALSLKSSPDGSPLGRAPSAETDYGPSLMRLVSAPAASTDSLSTSGLEADSVNCWKYAVHGAAARSMQRSMTVASDRRWNEQGLLSSSSNAPTSPVLLDPRAALLTAAEARSLEQNQNRRPTLDPADLVTAVRSVASSASRFSSRPHPRAGAEDLMHLLDAPDWRPSGRVSTASNAAPLSLDALGLAGTGAPRSFRRPSSGKPVSAPAPPRPRDSLTGLAPSALPGVRPSPLRNSRNPLSAEVIAEESADGVRSSDSGDADASTRHRVGKDQTMETTATEVTACKNENPDASD